MHSSLTREELFGKWVGVVMTVGSTARERGLQSTRWACLTMQSDQHIITHRTLFLPSNLPCITARSRRTDAYHAKSVIKPNLSLEHMNSILAMISSLYVPSECLTCCAAVLLLCEIWFKLGTHAELSMKASSAEHGKVLWCINQGHQLRPNNPAVCLKIAHSFHNQNLPLSLYRLHTTYRIIS